MIEAGLISPDLKYIFHAITNSATLPEKTLRRITQRSSKQDANKPVFNLERNFRKQLNPDLSNLRRKRNLFRKIGVLEKSELKLQRSTEKRDDFWFQLLGG